jgi:hypothetical protein
MDFGAEKNARISADIRLDKLVMKIVLVLTGIFSNQSSHAPENTLQPDRHAFS